MPTEEILILTRSQKHGGRCIAGLSTRDGRWVRPVSGRGHGELYPHHYTMGGQEARILDVVEFEHQGRTGEPEQPENLRVARSEWRHIDRVSPAEAYERIRPAIVKGPELVSSRSHYVEATVASRGLDGSLALIEPTGLSFTLERHSTKPQGSPRATFWLDGQYYDLPLTEFVIKPRLLKMSYGTYSFSDLGLTEPSHSLLVVSLGTPYNERHYKLVAAVLPLP